MHELPITIVSPEKTSLVQIGRDFLRYRDLLLLLVDLLLLLAFRQDRDALLEACGLIARLERHTLEMPGRVRAEEAPAVAPVESSGRWIQSRRRSRGDCIGAGARENVHRLRPESAPAQLCWRVTKNRSGPAPAQIRKPHTPATGNFRRSGRHSSQEQKQERAQQYSVHQRAPGFERKAPAKPEQQRARRRAHGYRCVPRVVAGDGANDH